MWTTVSSTSSELLDTTTTVAAQAPQKHPQEAASQSAQKVEPPRAGRRHPRPRRQMQRPCAGGARTAEGAPPTARATAIQDWNNAESSVSACACGALPSAGAQLAAS